MMTCYLKIPRRVRSVQFVCCLFHFPLENLFSKYVVECVYAMVYLFQWDESVEYLEKGLSMYDQMLNKEDQEMAVISGMAHTTSHLYETYLYLPDRTEVPAD